MGMEVALLGMKPVDDKFKKMYEVYRACEFARVKVPEEVLEFFDYKKLTSIDRTESTEILTYANDGETIDVNDLLSRGFKTIKLEWM